MRRYYLHLLGGRNDMNAAVDAMPRVRASISPTDVRRPQKKRKARAMTSSERGIKFRKKQHERQQQLMASTDALRREIARLQALKDMRGGSSLAASVSEGGAPLRFALEYFAQFRFGVAGKAPTPATRMATTVEQQVAFLKAMVEPDALFNGIPAVSFVMNAFSQKKMLSSFRMEREASNLVGVEDSAVIVNTGVSHMRYSRHTIEQLFPHILGNEELVRKLVGRQLHMPFKVTMFFNARGRLARGEFERDMVVGMYEVLRDVDECAALLGREAVDQFLVQHQSDAKKHRKERIAVDCDRFEEIVEETDVRRASQVDERPSSQPPTSPAAPMDLKFILS
jgi:hypothetical protein